MNSKQCVSADEMWASLEQHIADDADPPLNRKFLFRGAAKATYDLRPSAHRENSLAVRLAQRIPNIGWANRSLTADGDLFDIERDLLNAFLRGVDSQGFHVVGDDTANRARLKQQSPHVDLGGVELLFAYAQHAGCATRLLDWTTSPFVAMYFAATGAMRRVAEQAGSEIRAPVNLSPYGVISVVKPGDDSLAVWVLDAAKVGTIPNHTLAVIFLPPRNNANLARQHGAFTYTTDSGRNGVPPTVEELANAAGLRVDLTKYTLELKEAPRLLRRLLKYGFHGAALFPDSDGLRRYVEDELLSRFDIQYVESPPNPS